MRGSHVVWGVIVTIVVAAMFLAFVSEPHAQLQDQAKAEAAIFRRAADQVLKKGGAPATYPERESREPLASPPDSDEAQKKGDAPPTDAERESRKPLTSAPEKE